MPTAEAYTVNFPFDSIDGDSIAIANASATWAGDSELGTFIWQGDLASVEDDDQMYWYPGIIIPSGAEMRIRDATNSQVIVTWVYTWASVPVVQGPLSTMSAGQALWVLEFRYWPSTPTSDRFNSITPYVLRVPK